MRLGHLSLVNREGDEQGEVQEGHGMRVNKWAVDSGWKLAGLYTRLGGD